MRYTSDAFGVAFVEASGNRRGPPGPENKAKHDSGDAEDFPHRLISPLINESHNLQLFV